MRAYCPRVCRRLLLPPFKVTALPSQLRSTPSSRLSVLGTLNRAHSPFCYLVAGFFVATFLVTGFFATGFAAGFFAAGFLAVAMFISYRWLIGRLSGLPALLLKCALHLNPQTALRTSGLCGSFPHLARCLVWPGLFGASGTGVKPLNLLLPLQLPTLRCWPGSMR